MILVTGGTGLIGSHLLFKLLSEDKTIRIKAIKRKNSNLYNVKKVFSYYADEVENLFYRIEWIDVDILDYYELFDVFENVKKVYHCAGVVSYNQFQKDLIYNVNVIGTKNIVNCCLEREVEKLVHVSSIASLGTPEKDNLIREDSKLTIDEDSTIYSKCKFLGELEVWRGIEEGLNAVIVNPAVVLGPGFWESKGIGLVLERIYKGFRFYTEGITGFVDVRDVVNIMVLLMNSEIKGERFILCEGNYSLEQILRMIMNAMGKDEIRIKANDFMLKFISVIEYLLWLLFRKTPVLTPEALKLAKQQNYYSNEKIKNFLNYNFIPIEETIKFVVEKFLEDYRKEKY